MSTYKLVPAEPTNKMIVELIAVGLRHAEYVDGQSPTFDDIKLGYKFMLAAAPEVEHEPEASRGAAQAEAHRLREWIKETASQYDICTRNVLRKVCDGCRCQYRKQGGE